MADVRIHAQPFATGSAPEIKTGIQPDRTLAHTGGDWSIFVVEVT